MHGCQMTFKRCEIKYLLSEQTYQNLRRLLEEKMRVDQYGKTTICNIYYDTPDFRIIRNSLEKPVYKEKLRLRSYGTPAGDGTVFVELKKKYKGVVYKRREDMVLSEAERYLGRGIRPGFESQVLREIDWFLRYYQDIRPAMYISYERVAMNDLEDPALRLTFDSNILWRDQELRLGKGSWGTPVLEQGQRLMEVKIQGAMPLWLGKIFDELRIFPVSFSKYGKAYCQRKERKTVKGGIHCA